jgi:prepilin-type N-terminal cleavage/methylation domain-containing protein/prepilin-type processing-associated H-X9-DG protein
MLLHKEPIAMSAISRRSSRHLGFTLVELLVVISVIVILMGMVLPVLQSSAARARELKCLSNLSQIAKAIITYSGNFDGFIPAPAHSDTFPADDESVVNLNGGDNPDPLFDGHKEAGEYVSYTWKGKLIFYVGTVSSDEEELYALYKCPTVRFFRNHKSFYGTNAYLTMWTNEERVRETDGDTTTFFQLAHFDDIEETARTFLVGENNDGHWAVKPKYPAGPTDFKKISDYGEAPDYPGQVYEGEVYARHAKRCSWVYCDGHAEPLRVDKIHEYGCRTWRVDKTN